jgi:TPR repeat protein
MSRALRAADHPAGIRLTVPIHICVESEFPEYGSPMKNMLRLVVALSGLTLLSVGGIFVLGNLTDSGVNPAKVFELDPTQFEALKGAASRGDADANFRLGQFWMFVGRANCAKSWFQSANDLGDSRAASWLLYLQDVSGVAECPYQSR